MVFVVRPTQKVLSRTISPDQSLIAVMGICLVLAASLAPHFGFVPGGSNAFIKAHSSCGKQQSLANDALQWSVPYAQFAPAPPLPCLTHSACAEHWNYSPDDVAAQRYNRPPPSA